MKQDLMFIGEVDVENLFKKVVSYPLQEVSINPSICWYFLTTDTLSKLPLLSELVSDSDTVVNLHNRLFILKTACLRLNALSHMPVS